MADRYLLESGAPDGYLLEDSSGVLLLEGSDFSPFGEMTNSPTQPRQLYTLKTAAIAAFSLVAPVFVEPSADVAASAISAQVLRQNPIQYQALAFTHTPVAAPEVVTIDKWLTESPTPPKPPKRPDPAPVAPGFTPIAIDWLFEQPLQGRKAPREHPNPYLIHVEAAAEVVTLDKWHQYYVTPPRWIAKQHPDAAFVRIDVAAEIVTLDKWLTDSPAHYFKPPILHDTIGFLDIFPEVVPPEPPEPPEPPPQEVQKPGLHVRVRHLKRPPGGFNTVYYVDDD